MIIINKNKGQRNGAFAPKQDFVKIAVPSQEENLLEALIDLFVSKGYFTEDELEQAASYYGSYVNALLDLLIVKGKIQEWELEISLMNYHDYNRAGLIGKGIPVQIALQQRREVLKQRILMREEEKKLLAQSEAEVFRLRKALNLIPPEEKKPVGPPYIPTRKEPENKILSIKL